MADLGLITPNEQGEWRWPFARMAVGDVFIVDPVSKPIRQVRTVAYARGYQLGKKFSVKMGPYGYIRVECVERSDRARPLDRPIIGYATARTRLASIYGLRDRDIDGVPWETCQDNWEPHFEGAEMLEDCHDKDWIIANYAGRFHIHVGGMGFTVMPVDPGMTYNRWRQEQDERELLELMS
ncbi:MAG TPA: hypothetical protein VF614_15110 [Chthoniobacteraceae bacterium]